MEELPNFQLFSSQNSDLDNEQLDEIEQKAQAKNTKKATEWGVKKFEKWWEKRKNYSGSCLADRIVATTFHTIVSCYISVKHFFLLNEFVRFGLVYW